MRSLVCILFFLLLGCAPKVEVSAVKDPIWLEQGETVPFDCWGVTRGWMDMAIRHTK